ncbi:MarR family winged helix-turn-helix transcriptional regulator [Psychromicrobium xiongbiense]|uniref:MarR family winged helix-turn-helix transcriptional regulator n=1 Tax=Psychromicrobium xiongbiense TaxID=3051184 RepID=UPI00255582FD|nr:MarR family transcriptional regulator [Psychromicrobium sp. YIM S02556]
MVTGDAQLVEQWRSVQSVYLRTSNAIERELESRFKIGCSEFEILDLLAEKFDDSCRMKHLAESSPLTQSALSRIVDRLEKAGLVERAACQDDRRSLLVGLTEAGHDLHLAAATVQRGILKDQLALS